MNTDSYLYNPQQTISANLRPGEKILWTGQPPAGLRLCAADVSLIPFSLLWGGFAIIWEVLVIRSHAPPLFRLCGIPFVIIGIYMIIGRFFVDAYRRNRTYYGVTSDRIIIVTGGWSQKINSLNIRTLSNLSITERRNGAATITFGPIIVPYGYSRRSNSWPGMSGYNASRFELGQDGRKVYEIILAAQSRSQQT
ncbi:MAG TPA: hypothetical protein VG722_05445 [Tepidisphaeraceae bacterium]|nr:hypothetical protein [Tepidisphaeraceae bacterium]